MLDSVRLAKQLRSVASAGMFAQAFYVQSQGTPKIPNVIARFGSEAA